MFTVIARDTKGNKSMWESDASDYLDARDEVIDELLSQGATPESVLVLVK
jgi:hypothetical protein